MEKEIKWFYNIGDIIKDEKRDLVITGRKIIPTKRIDYRDNREYMFKLKFYKYKCNKCGFECGEHYNVIKEEFKDESWVHESNMKKQGCSCCCHNPQVVAKGINDINTTHPLFLELFANKDDIYKYTYGSSKKVLLKCPNCGITKRICLSNLTVIGRTFPCDNCGDNVPIPEKIVFNILKILKESGHIGDFKTQLTKIDYKWCFKYKYDFYINDFNIIIETHGMQHYDRGFERIKSDKQQARTIEEEQENDRIKKELALSNGIKEENYIIIDCRYSELDFIKQNILNSRLNEIFDLSNIDWVKLWESVQKSLLLDTCKFKNDNPNYFVREISDILNIGQYAVRSYLKRGTDMGICRYSGSEERSRANAKNVKWNTKQRKPINVYKDGLLLGEFDSISKLANTSEDTFGEKLNISAISRVCNGKAKEYKGYVFKFI